MDRTESKVRNMLRAIEAPLYDVGVLSSRGMLPGLDGIPASAVLERLPCSSTAMPVARTSTSVLQGAPLHGARRPRRSLARETVDRRLQSLRRGRDRAGNFQARLRHAAVFPKLLDTLARQTLAAQ